MSNQVPEGFYVEIVAPSGLRYRWHGAHTVNIYSDLYSGYNEVDVLSVGTPREPTFEEVLESVQGREADMLAEREGNY